MTTVVAIAAALVLGASAYLYAWLLHKEIRILTDALKDHEDRLDEMERHT